MQTPALPLCFELPSGRQRSDAGMANQVLTIVSAKMFPSLYCGINKFFYNPIQFRARLVYAYILQVTQAALRCQCSRNLRQFTRLSGGGMGKRIYGHGLERVGGMARAAQPCTFPCRWSLIRLRTVADTDDHDADVGNSVPVLGRAFAVLGSQCSVPSL